MTHRLQTIAIAALAAALAATGMAVAHGDRNGDRDGPSPFALDAGRSLTYSETHLRKDGQDVTLRLDQGRVLAASDSAISIRRNDGETVEVPVDGDTRVLGHWWRRHWGGKARASHDRDDAGSRRRGFSVADIRAGKRVLVARTDDDPAAEAVTLVKQRHHWRHRDRDDD